MPLFPLVRSILQCPRFDCQQQRRPVRSKWSCTNCRLAEAETTVLPVTPVLHNTRKQSELRVVISDGDFNRSCCRRSELNACSGSARALLQPSLRCFSNFNRDSHLVTNDNPKARPMAQKWASKQCEVLSLDDADNSFGIIRHHQALCFYKF